MHSNGFYFKPQFLKPLEIAIMKLPLKCEYVNDSIFAIIGKTINKKYYWY